MKPQTALAEKPLRQADRPFDSGPGRAIPSHPSMRGAMHSAFATISAETAPLNNVRFLLDYAVQAEGLQRSACYDVWNTLGDFAVVWSSSPEYFGTVESAFSGGIDLVDPYAGSGVVCNPLWTVGQTRLLITRAPTGGGTLDIYSTRVTGRSITTAHQLEQGFRAAASALYDLLPSSNAPPALFADEDRVDWDFSIESLSPSESRMAKARFIQVSRPVPEFIDDREE
jgi:hypothetical protein